nr:hypothetical protein [Mesorhizobium sp.]
MLRFLRRLFRTVLIVLAVIVAIPVLGLAYGWLATAPVGQTSIVSRSPEVAAISQRLATEIAGYKRPEESTFLTYPEWSIVYSAREYADFVQDNNPANFPYLAHIGRFWKDYAAMIRASADYPFNFENHLMLTVIGTSHTIEHVIQLVYENTIGRITWAFGGAIGEDAALARIASDYAAFLDQTPWYRFPYAERRKELWTLPAAPGWAAVRSWERKLGYGAALTVKQAYADLIASGLSATSDAAFLDIHVWAQGPVADAIAGEADTSLERDLGADGAVFVTKRYQVFTEMIPRLIERGVSFVEIGGNDDILVTVVSNEEIDAPDGTMKLFSYPLPTDNATIRTGLTVPVPMLHEALPDLINAGAQLEHVYDY